MKSLLSLALPVTLLGPVRPSATVVADSASVSFTSAPVYAEFPTLPVEDALALLQAEHHFSIPILLLEDPAAPTR